MTKIFLQKASSGYQFVRGELVRKLQVNLQSLGHDLQLIDGIFGSDTEAAVKAYQVRKGQQPTGKVTDDNWPALMLGTPTPSVFDRCLQLTAAFEGQGFQKLVGNFDGAGLTWGIIGYTLKHGELPKILSEAQQRFPALIQSAFGPLSPTLFDIIGKPWVDQRDWANGISIGTNKYRVEEKWRVAFDTFGSYAEIQEIQLRRVIDYWAIAQRDANRFGIKSERGIALTFDVAVQNGGIDDVTEGLRISNWIRQNSGVSEGDVLVRIADVIADSSNPKYSEDVRKRKRAIAIGDGIVHEARYALRDWGITELAYG